MGGEGSPMVRIVFGMVLGVAVFAASPAGAQDFWRTIITPRPPAAPPPAQQPAAVAPGAKQQVRIIETPPAYEGEMARLAEILGALHYLRPLCGAADGSRWRTEMSGLIEAEQPPEERRAGLIASFNRSYNVYQQTYRSCTPAAELAISRFVEEGAKLSREIATRYGN
jgi:uncharacterized protein (TIGR02301 family)